MRVRENKKMEKNKILSEKVRELIRKQRSDTLILVNFNKKVREQGDF